MRKRSKSATKLLLVTIMTASMSITSWAGEWQLNNEEWQYLNDDGTYASNGWHWIDGRCYYFEGAYRDIDNASCIQNDTVDRYYNVDASGAWVFNGTVVEEGSELAQKLTSDNFSGTYISTYLEIDEGNYVDNSYRIDINMMTDDATPPEFYLIEYYKKADGSWEKINSAIGGSAGQSLDENGNPLLICDDYGFMNNDTGTTVTCIIKNGDILQMIMDEGRTTYQKQN